MRKIDKMILGVFVHSYAPELNKTVLVTGTEIATPHARSGKDFSLNFTPANMWVRTVAVQVTNAEYPTLNTYYYWCSQDIKHDMGLLLARHNVAGTVITIERIESKFL